MIPSASTVIGRLLRVPLRLIPQRAEVTILSGINRGYRWIVGSQTHGCWIGNYETETQRLLTENVRAGMTAFDIGANAGFFTLALSRLVGPSGHVVAFEPNPRNLQSLHRHLAINNIRNVKVVAAAVSDKSGETRFSGQRLRAGRISGTGELTVRTVCLDDFAAPDFIKMDIEGGEELAIPAAVKTLAQRKTTWLVELHRDGIDKVFENAGYQVERISYSMLKASPM